MLFDTAGIRESENKVEQIGIELAKEEARNADLILYVVDSSLPLDENDQQILRLISDKPVILLLNKTDLEPVVTAEELKKQTVHTIIETSAATGSGLDELKDQIKDMFLQGDVSFNDEVFITNVRHKHALEEARESLEHVEEALEMDIPEDVYAIDLYGAVQTLDTIIGGNASEDLVDTIFEKFCMGK